MADRQQHSDSIDIVKRVIHVNKNKTPNFFSQIILPNRLNPVYCPINYLLQYITEMFIPAYVSSIISSDFKYTFSKIRHYISPTPTGPTPESLSNAIRRLNINA